MIRKNNGTDSSKSPRATDQGKTTEKRLFKIMHQLDCIYQGEVNQSYQREGFGIQQTFDF